MQEQADGITLGGLRYGDTSKIIRVFTREHGKLSFLAKGAIRKNNKYGASIEPLSISHFTYIRKPAGLHLLTSSELNEYFSKSITNMDILPISLAIVELINLTQVENDSNEYLYDLIKHFLELLDASKQEDVYNYFISFVIQYTGMLGYMIDTSQYNHQIPFNYFLLDDGVISLSGFAGKRFFKFSTPLLQKIAMIDSGEFVEFDLNEKQEFRRFTEDYFSFHLERKVKLNSLDLML
jgi:DNA repair protein RecO (recombination protein O)